ncbi:putative glutathione-S-transferase theta, GST [Fusarium sp. MPI-SDFR-AT-0072]|nr:putative glutathione-S-transferase theta, GST [Fusarium sp. MPI-SDFR-AT-0072]
MAIKLYEKGIDYEFITANFMTGEQKKPPYKQMMPIGQTPALEDGSLRLHESRAIARYISSKYRDQGNDLLPAVHDIQGWALFEQFASVEYSQVFDAALQVLYLKLFNPAIGIPSDETPTQTSVTKRHAKIDVVDKILATENYLGGAEFTVVDILYMPAMQMLHQAGQACLRAPCKHWFLVEESLAGNLGKRSM